MSVKIWSYKNFLIHEFELLSSTNSYAFELADLRKILDCEVILAHSQDAGKGRQGRSWSSPKGNLYFSLVLRPKISPAKISQISLLAIVALRNAIANLFTRHDPLRLKWPNDLLIEQKKCAGLLLESKLNGNEIEFLVIGIGLNIDSNPENTIFPSTNLKNFGITISPEETLKKILDEFQKSYQNYLDFGFAGVRKSWLNHAYGYLEKITVSFGKERISGIFINLDEDGNLLLQLDEGKVIKVSAADVS